MAKKTDIEIREEILLRVDDEKVYVTFQGKTVEREHKKYKSIKNVKRFALISLMTWVADACDRLEGAMAVAWLNAEKSKDGGTKEPPSEREKGEGSSKKATAAEFKTYWSAATKLGYTKELVHVLVQEKSIREWPVERLEKSAQQLEEHLDAYQKRITGAIRKTWTELGKKKTLWNEAIKKCKIDENPKDATIGQWFAVLEYLRTKTEDGKKSD